MKNLVFSTILMLCMHYSFSQVGIGTTTPDVSSILDIESTNKGLLIPRLTTAERDAIVDPANGLLIYNEDVNEFQFNTNSIATPIWATFSATTTGSSSPGDSLKYSNTDTTTDVNNNTAINLPVFGAMDWNDNASLYIVDGVNNTITISESGRYEIKVNASLSCSSSSRRAPEMYITVNGTHVGSYSSTGYMRRANGHNESSLHINEVISLSAGDVLSIEIIRAAQSGQVTLRSAGTTNFYISKIL